MNIFKSKVKLLIERKDFGGLYQLLENQPNLANKGITIPFDNMCRIKAHPLHRLCDAVFTKNLSDEEAIKLAQIFIDHGADIDGDKSKDGGTPLLGAASLHAEELGIFYIEKGADIHYTYKNNGESALHWASYCGRDKLVKKLIEAGANVDQPDKTYNSTPLGWALHSLKTSDKANKHNQIDCIQLLLKNGADAKKLDKEKNDYLLSLTNNDHEIQRLLI